MYNRFMEIRKAQQKEFKEITKIFDYARDFMIANGNACQWSDKSELDKNIYNDIQNGNCYVCIKENKIAAVFCFFIGNDSTYNKIYEGGWLNDKPYGVIHRIAVTVHKQGLASYCIQWCLSKFSNIRIDTHKDNIPMQKTILKNGFEYCGIIKKPDGTNRFAYQYGG